MLPVYVFGHHALALHVENFDLFHQRIRRFDGQRFPDGIGRKPYEWLIAGKGFRSDNDRVHDNAAETDNLLLIVENKHIGDVQREKFWFLAVPDNHIRNDKFNRKKRAGHKINIHSFARRRKTDSTRRWQQTCSSHIGMCRYHIHPVAGSGVGGSLCERINDFIGVVVVFDIESNTQCAELRWYAGRITKGKFCRKFIEAANRILAECNHDFRRRATETKLGQSFRVGQRRRVGVILDAVVIQYNRLQIERINVAVAITVNKGQGNLTHRQRRRIPKHAFLRHPIERSGYALRAGQSVSDADGQKVEMICYPVVVGVAGIHLERLGDAKVQDKNLGGQKKKSQAHDCSIWLGKLVRTFGILQDTVTESKLIELFRTFSPRQLTRLGDFLQSPYFNKSTDCILLFNYLQKYAPNFSHENLSRQIVVKKLAAEKPLDEKSLAHLSSRLLSLAEKFLSIEAFLANEWQQQVTLAQQYHTLNLPRHYKAAQTEIEKISEASPFRNAEYYREQLLVKRLFYEHSDRNQRGFNERLQAAADAVDIYFLAEKLRYAYEMLNYESVLNIRYEVTHLDEILSWAASPKYAEIPFVQVYRQLLQLLTAPEETQHFDTVKSLVVQSEQYFSAEELRQLYTLLLNYCIRRINRYNDGRFLHEHLEINKLLLQNGLIFESNLLPPWHYTNIVAAGLKTGQTDWTRQFIHDYRERLPPEYVENVFRYNLAQYHYHLKNYDEAQRALLQVEFNDVLLNITARSLLIKIYCETDQTELLLSYLEATRIFLLRNQLLEAHFKRQLQKFVEFTAKFAKIPPHHRERFQNLQEQLPPAQEMMHREWLAGQLTKKLERR